MVELSGSASPKDQPPLRKCASTHRACKQRKIRSHLRKEKGRERRKGKGKQKTKKKGKKVFHDYQVTRGRTEEKVTLRPDFWGGGE